MTRPSCSFTRMDSGPCPSSRRSLIYHLYQAALAGRDIFIDQKHRDALEMRHVIEQVVANPQGVDAATLMEVQRYAKLFWLNNGPYNNLTARKFVHANHARRLQGCRLRLGQGRREVRDRPGNDRPEARAPAADVLRCRRRSDRHQQDARRRQGHPAGQCEQSLLRRVARRPQGIHGEVRAEFAAGQARRQAGRRGLQGRRKVRQLHHRDHQASRSRPAVRRTADGEGARRLDQVLSDR